MKRKEAVLALFKDDDDKKSYGLTNKTLRYMIREIKKYRKGLSIEEGRIKKESDFSELDETWFELSRLMYQPHRGEF